VSWSPVPRATFLIYQSTTSATGTYSFLTTTASTSWTSGTLTSGTTYWYEVRTAFSASWIGANSTASSGHTIRSTAPFCV
jgi:hypothetical protein